MINERPSSSKANVSNASDDSFELVFKSYKNKAGNSFSCDKSCQISFLVR